MKPNAGIAPSIFSDRHILLWLTEGRTFRTHPPTGEFSVRPAVMYEEYWEARGTTDLSEKKCAPWTFINKNNDHFFTSNGKMRCACFSLPAGPVEFEGTCPAAAPLFKVRSVSFKDEDGRIVTKRLREAPDAQQDRWICNKCYAMSAGYAAPSKILKDIALLEWVRSSLQAGTFVSALSEILELYLSDAADSYSAILQSDSDPEKKSRDLADVPHPSYVRVHDAGDFFSAQYLKGWCDIARNFPEQTFWASTRVWAAPAVWKQIQAAKIRIPDNMILRPSALFLDEMPPSVPGMRAGSMVQSKKAFKQGVPLPKGVYACPATYSKISNCQLAEASYPEHRRRQRELAWPSGCRHCWDAPNSPVAYLEH